MKKLLESLQKVLRRYGFQIVFYNTHYLSRRMRLVNYHGINVLLDVGANAGQYAHKMRNLGYKHKIVSFEPLSTAFTSLSKLAANDKLWQVNNYAMGDKETQMAIHIAGNSESSSLLNMLPVHEESVPSSKYIAEETIDIKRLDDIFDSFCGSGDKVMLKIDVQGYEKNVLIGAAESLKKIALLQLEMSITRLYEGELLYLEMIDYLDELGFRLVSVEGGLSDPITGELQQMDGIFVNKTLDNLNIKK